MDLSIASFMLNLMIMLINRFDFIDIAKGIGIILVVCSHSMYSDLMYVASSCFIPLFYVVSGYVTSKVDIRKKARRLLKPYIFFNVVLLVLMWLSGLKEITFTHLWGVLYSRYALYRLDTVDNQIYMNIGNSPLWFLTSMFLAFVWFDLLLRIKKKGSRFILLLVYLFITDLLSRSSILLPWSIDTSFLMAIFIYCGYAVRHKEWGIEVFSNKVICGLVICYSLCLLINGYTNLSVGDFGKSVWLTAIAGITGSLILIKCAVWLAKTRCKNILIGIGKNSLIIFCIQMPLLFVVERTYLYMVGGDLGECEFIFGALFQILFSIVIGYLISKVLIRIVPWVFN